MIPPVFRTFLQELHKLVERLVLRNHRVPDVRPVEPGHTTRSVPKAQPLDDVGAGLRVGRCGESDHRDTGEERAQFPEADVFRPEVVPPLRNAVSLVDGEQADAYSRKPAEERVGHEPLGRYIEQVKLPRMQSCQHPSGFGLAEGGIVEGGAHPVGDESVDLVLHQGYQGRYDDADAGPVESRDLVADRLPPAGRHQDEIILAPDQSLHDLLLERPERIEAEKRP